MTNWRLRVKRGIDVGGAALGLLALAPVLLVVGAAVRLTLGPPVFFRQCRAGRQGRTFTPLKFRTMTDARDAAGNLLPEAQRLTRLGRLLRKSSLDELPQLWNVLRGEMSLVGPRPLLLEYLPRYTPEQQKRHDVPPGITGWAQVNGRQALRFSERLKLDVWYVQHWGLGLDLKILCLTVLHVLSSRGVKLDQTIEEVDDLGLAVPPAAAARGQREEVPPGPRQAEEATHGR